MVFLNFKINFYVKENYFWPKIDFSKTCLWVSCGASEKMTQLIDTSTCVPVEGILFLNENHLEMRCLYKRLGS
jgi:hypothetical protein